MLKQPTRKPNRDLTGKERGHLKALAHHLHPLVIIGKDGVTEGIKEAIIEALTVHELIKVRILENAELSLKEAAQALATSTGSHVVGTLGRIAILYRMSDDKPKIVLPK